MMGSTATQRRIVVFGVTGNQGASVALSLLADNGRFNVYGVTRNPDSAASQKMAGAGVKLVQGDLDDPATYESSLIGAHGVFLNANFWANYNGKNPDWAAAAEVRQSTEAINAAMRAKVQHVVYSTLESYLPRQPLPHFDAKAKVTEYMKQNQVPSTQLYTSYFYDNLLLAKTREGEDGKTVISLPLPDDTVLPSFNPHQIGLWAREAFRDPETWIGKDMYACGDNITLAGIAKVLSEESGKQFDTEHHTAEDFLALDGTGKIDQELFLNYKAFLNGEMKRDPAESRKVVPEAQDFRAWVKATPKVGDHFGF